MLQCLKEFLAYYSINVHWVDEFSYVFTYTSKLGFRSKSLLNPFHRVHFSHHCACVGSPPYSSGTLSQTPNPRPLRSCTAARLLLLAQNLDTGLSQLHVQESLHPWAKSPPLCDLSKACKCLLLCLSSFICFTVISVLTNCLVSSLLLFLKSSAPSAWYSVLLPVYSWWIQRERRRSSDWCFGARD